jgi:hypothetical protein
MARLGFLALETTPRRRFASRSAICSKVPPVPLELMEIMRQAGLPPKPHPRP